MKWSNKATGISVGGLLVLFLIGHWGIRCYQNEVVLLPRGKAKFIRGSFLHRDRFCLEYRHGAWRFTRKELDGGELIAPFECKYNEHRYLRLEDNGKVYLIDRKRMIREELRIVNGEWSYDAGDHWQSIFDLDVY